VWQSWPVTSNRRYLGTPEAARQLGIDRTTLYRAYQSERLRPAMITPGGKPRWDVADLRAQLGLPPEDAMTSTLTRTDDPVVAAIVTSRAGVLITRRHDGKPPVGFVSGEVEEGESAADAAVREVKEEIGLAVTAQHLLGERDHPKTGRRMVYMAAVPTENLDIHVGDTEELAAVEWVPTWSALTALIPEEHIYAPVAQHLRLVLPE
jgi:8-oxo-dGTP pyrophosphatase MutT (NUDIX family)/predicted DNA-binding transcriptional regulator AlpA